MKKNHRFIYALALTLLGLAAVVNYGCGKKETPTSGQKPTPTEPRGAAIVSAEKTSFSEVTSQLDPGGNFYLYLGTEQWLDGISTKVAGLRQVFTSMPDLKEEDRANIDKTFDIVTHVIKDSGIEDVSGVGMSSIAIEKGFYHNKALLHHYAGRGSGFLWTIFGKESHPLTGLDLCPDNTAMAVFSDMDLPLAWSVVQQEVNQSGFPQAQAWLEKMPAAFEQQTQIKWDRFLASLGGEIGLVVTFNESNQIPIPLPTSEKLEIPEPGLLIVLKVKDDTIFDRIDQALKQNPQTTSVDKAGLKMRTMPFHIPLPLQLRPTVATSDGYLLIATSDTIIEEALAVKAGQKAGLKSTGEFKHLAQNLPSEGNQFTFISQRFGQTVMQIQRQALALNAKSSPAQGQWMQSLMNPKQTAYSFTVGGNTPDGWLTTGNGSQSAAQALLIPAVAVGGMLSAIAIPNFVKARTVSQENACINNLRQLDAAKQEWALEKSKKSTDTPIMDDLKPYLPKIPLCPAGGDYTLNTVGEPPECSIPGHKLP